MKFSYFANGDNRYKGNTRTANECITQMVEECIYAEQLGMHGAWIGEHHFNEFGVNTSPHVALMAVAAQTQRIRVMPGVVVLPLHHPIQIAEDWATLDLLSAGRVDFHTGRGFDRNEYDRFEENFLDNSGKFAEGLEILRRSWSETGRWSHKGKYYAFENADIGVRPVQDPIPIYVACFSKPTVELTGKYGFGMGIAPFAAGMSFGGVDKQIAAYREECEKNGHAPGPVCASYFLHFCQTPEEERAARNRQIRFFHENVLGATPHDPKRAGPTYQYFVDMTEKINRMKPEDLRPGSVLLGNAQQVGEAIAKIAEDGVDEVGLYVGIGLKDPQQTRDEMQNFMEDVAPQFDGPHKTSLAAE